MSAVDGGFTILKGLTPMQQQLVLDDHRFVVTPSGRRSRKTLIGKSKTLVRAMRKPGRYFSGAPTRAQAKAIFWDHFKKETKGLWRRDPDESDLIIYLANQSELHVVGLNKPARIEGQPWHGCHVTEMADVPAKAWPENIRPVLSDTLGWAYLDGVPEGRGDWYDICLGACGGPLPITSAGRPSYRENPVDPEWAYYHWFSADVLDSKEIAAAKRVLDQQTFEQEYEGSFAGGDGLAYYPYCDENNAHAEVDPRLPIHIGMDFNYNPMGSIAAQEYDDPETGLTIPYILESFAFRNCDTGPACNRIIDHFGEERDYIIYPDAACQSGSSHGDTGKTDLIIIKQAFQRVVAAGGSYKIRVRPANPTRKDRLNAVNAKLRNALGQIGMKISPNCKFLIKDFQKATREEYLNGNFDDPLIGHVSDALGYYIEYRFPVRGAGIGSGYAT